MFRRLLMAGGVLLSSLAAGAGDSPPPGVEALPVAQPSVATVSAGTAALAGQPLTAEVEPNNSVAQATPLLGGNLVVLGNIYPNADVDYYGFAASGGDRVYAAVMSSFSASLSTDSVLEVLDTDGTTVLEADDNDGSFGMLASTVAGTLLPAAGTYYLRVRHFSGTAHLRPYHLHVRLQVGSPAAEVEPNNAVLTAQPLPASGWVTGTVSSVDDTDWYSLTLQAGDTIFASLDLDPERDNVQWNGWLGLAYFGGFLLVVNDGSAGSPSNPLSEAHFLTVREAGTYYVYVAVPPAGTTFGTYSLSVSVHAPQAPATHCATYTSSNVPQAIPAGPGVMTSTLTIPASMRVADLDVSLSLTHTRQVDLDVSLVSPSGNEVGLFTDVGNFSAGVGNFTLNLELDDEAALPIGQYTILDGMRYQTEAAFRLDWFDDQDAAGVWSLVVRDDLAAEGGNLLSWGLTACEAPPPPACPAGSGPVTVFAADFESGAAGFTHSGSGDEWELGLPVFPPLSSCNSGSSCWVTDLDDTYNASSSQDLLSPSISLAGYLGAAWVSWAQKYQLESATFDHSYVDVQQAGGAAPRRLWEWLGATMAVVAGSPAVSVQESAGWGTHSAGLNDYLGQSIELRFHLDGDTTVQYAGLAIDDVAVMACAGVPDFAGSSKDPDRTTVTAGSLLTYTVQVTNDGLAAGTYTLTDTLPAGVTLVSAPGWSGTTTLTTTGTVASQDEAERHIVVRANAGFTGTVVNTALLSGDGFIRNLVASAVTVEPRRLYLPIIRR